MNPRFRWAQTFVTNADCSVFRAFAAQAAEEPAGQEQRESTVSPARAITAFDEISVMDARESHEEP